MAQVEQHTYSDGVTRIVVVLTTQEARDGANVMVRVDKGTHTDDVGYVLIEEDADLRDDGIWDSNGGLSVSAGLDANPDDCVENTYPDYFMEVTA